MSILVVGSINIDIVNRVKKHPVPGETIKGLGTVFSPGGKGANQAVAASRAGGNVIMLGAVGEDPYGKELLSTLENFNVKTEHIIKKEGTSGMAFITVDHSGENSIILSEGSNGLVSVQDLEEKIHLLDEAEIVLLQNEIPWESTLFTLKEAKVRNVQTIFNPAPALEIPEDVFPFIDILVLNETEIEVVTGICLSSEENKQKAIKMLLNFGVQTVILTLGEKGCICHSKSELPIAIQGFKVTTVDTTAAGDTFIGSLSAALVSGKDNKDAILFATAASALTVTKQGAQNSIPSQSEVEEFLSLQVQN